jgi:hypothetical protein
MIGSVMDVFESAAALLGVTFVSRIQTPTDASKRASLIDVVGL